MHRETQTQSDSESQNDSGRVYSAHLAHLHCVILHCDTFILACQFLQFANEFLEICSLTFAKIVSGECFLKRLSLLGVSLSHFPLFFLLQGLACSFFLPSLSSPFSLSLSPSPPRPYSLFQSAHCILPVPACLLLYLTASKS